MDNLLKDWKIAKKITPTKRGDMLDDIAASTDRRIFLEKTYWYNDRVAVTGQNLERHAKEKSHRTLGKIEWGIRAAPDTPPPPKPPS